MANNNEAPRRSRTGGADQRSKHGWRWIAAAVATVLLAGCAQASDAAEPAPVPGPEAQTPTPTPAPGRPFQTIASSCETIVSIGALEAAAGVVLTSGGTFNDDPVAARGGRLRSGTPAASNAPGRMRQPVTVRVSLTLVPEAVAADERIRAEFAALDGGTATAAPRPLFAFCIYDYCGVKACTARQM